MTMNDMNNTNIPPAHMRRLRLCIQGAVQGVGFRPFVYRLATEMHLCGWIVNDTQGVVIEVEGAPPVLSRFLERLPNEKPPLAHIHALDATWREPVGLPRFEIRQSDHQGSKSVLVLPDIATCHECVRDTMDPHSRRYRYPFTNCTNCGPRLSIVLALPYDRPATTMHGFTMCPDCQQEYETPTDRRFHAQPNACPVCGPQLFIAGDGPAGDAALRAAAAALHQGHIVAVKGIGGFHLMVDARNAGAVVRLRERKHRPHKPLALMVRDLAQAQELCEVSPAAAALLASPEAPIVLLPRLPATPDTPDTPAIATVAANIAPDTGTLGVMLPCTPLHHLLLHEVGFPLVATSGNLSDEPICTDNDEALARLGHIADLFLLHNRPIARHVDDSIAWVVSVPGEDGPRDEPGVLRRARGYAPLPVLVRQRVPCILAVGAHQKNTIALSIPTPAPASPHAPHTPVCISQHIGTLETPEALDAFERVIADFLRLYDVTPAAIAHDMHPDYHSTRWAQHNAAAHTLLVPVQHHHAHLAACLAENGVSGTALGVIWDGTGYGTDGTVWGGEWLYGDATGYTRVASLRPFRLPGGDMAVREPRRVALALLWEVAGDDMLELEPAAETLCAPLRSFAPGERRLLVQMMQRGVNAPVTTSAGRLFDGVAALIGLQPHVTFEGQAAVALEHLADPAEPSAYPLPVVASGSDRGAGSTDEQPPMPMLCVDWHPLVAAVLHDLHDGTAPAIMAARFHNALVDAVVAVAHHIGEPRVALSGGCFQNRLLTVRAAQRLHAAGFTVVLHRQVPPNDGGISLGQVAVAAATLHTHA